MRDAYAHCESLVREADKDRFLAALFAPAERRPDLFALYAFNVEIARVRDVAREPMPGEVRLQWWRDALGGEGHGEVTAHPVAGALLETIRRRALPLDPLIGMIDAHGFDLYEEPMATMADLEQYARATSSMLFASAARILADRGDAVIDRAAEAGGIAYGLASLLRAFPRHAGRRQLYLPVDLLDRHGVTADDIFARRANPSLSAALSEVRARAAALLAHGEALAAAAPPPARPAFLPFAMVGPLLRRLGQTTDPFAPVEIAQWRRQWALWRAARRLG